MALSHAYFKRQLHLLALIGILLPLSGCIINPIYHLKDLIRIAGIEGRWEPFYDDYIEDFSSWEISKADSNKYYIRHNTDGQDQYFIGGFLKLNGTLYADVAQIDYAYKKYKVQGTHNVLKISLRGDTLSGNLMDLDYLDRCIRSKKYSLPFETYTDRSSDYNTGTTIYVTASISQLQAFLKANEKDTLLFPPRESILLRRADGAFWKYFPEDAWNFDKLRKRPDIPAALKATPGSDWYGRDVTSIQGIVDSLAGADLLYKPFYFQIATQAGVRNRTTLDSALATRYVAYVLNHTREFLHYFNGSRDGSVYALHDWADLLRISAIRSGTLDATVATLKANCLSCGPTEQRLLYQFMQIVRPDREAYIAAINKQMRGQSDGIEVLEAEATPIKIAANPIQLVYPAGDSVYLLTGLGYNDTVLAKITSTITLEPMEPAPIKETLTLDPNTLKSYVLHNGQIVPLPGAAAYINNNGAPAQETSGRRKLTIYNWTVRDATPLCYAFKYIPGEKPSRLYLINFCGDTNKVLATMQTYGSSNIFGRFMRHHCIPVNYVGADGTCYAVVGTGGIVRQGEHPLAHVAVYRQGKMRIYRVWTPGGNQFTPMLNCFAQNGYCYLYDRWNGGSGQKDSSLYRFSIK